MAEGAIAHCAHCEWTAQVSDDTVVGAAMTLRQLLIDHVREQHSDCITGRIAYGDPLKIAAALERGKS
jgi:hypothetical protein